MYKILVSCLFILCLSPSALASTSKCIEEDWRKVEYYSEKRGAVQIYIINSTGDISVNNLACTLGVYFLANRNAIPNKALVGFVTEDKLHSRFAQWNLKDNYLILTQLDLDPKELQGRGEFLFYPGALGRIKEVLLHQPLPATVEANGKTIPVKKMIFRASILDIIKILENK